MKDSIAASKALWLKTPHANLVRYVPSGIYFSRIRVRGKLIRRSLKTNKLAVAKLRLGDLEKVGCQRVEVQGPIVSGNMRFGDALAVSRYRLTARFRAAELEIITGRQAEAGLEDEFVVVQGVADLAVLLPQEIWLVDFKTDVVNAGGLAEKVKGYRPQLQLYAAALEKVFGRAVTLRALHFLALGQTETV